MAKVKTEERIPRKFNKMHVHCVTRKRKKRLLNEKYDYGDISFFSVGEVEGFCFKAGCGGFEP